jgi:hypothetical protein
MIFLNEKWKAINSIEKLWEEEEKGGKMWTVKHLCHLHWID